MKYTEVKAKCLRVGLDGDIMMIFKKLVKAITEGVRAVGTALKKTIEAVIEFLQVARTENVNRSLYGSKI